MGQLFLNARAARLLGRTGECYRAYPAPEDHSEAEGDGSCAGVLVGRSEVLRPSFEKQLGKEFQAGKRDVSNVCKADRYGSAYQERVNELAPPKVTKAEL
ncbi:MAG: hypothetical protein ABGZ49_14585 [Akkermansiaceae bacterium]